MMKDFDDVDVQHARGRTVLSMCVDAGNGEKEGEEEGEEKEEEEEEENDDG